MGRSPCCSKVGLNRGSWTAKEDKILTDYVKEHGAGQWRNLPKNAGLKRCGKSCRLRWINYLKPGVKRGNISPDEEDLIIRLHNLLGNRWSLIAGRLPGRTDNEVKNYWNTVLKKKVRSIKQSNESKHEEKIANLTPLVNEKPYLFKPKATVIQPNHILLIECTNKRLLVANQQPHSVENDDIDNKLIADATMESEEDLMNKNDAIESKSGEKNDFGEDYLLNLMEDFKLEDLLLSDESDFDFLKLSPQLDVGINDTLLFTEEMLKDFVNDDCVQWQNLL